MDELRSHHHVTYACHYHVVWCPKYRRKVLVKGVDDRLKQIIREVCAEHNALMENLEVLPDQVHLLVEVDPQFGIHRLVRLLKGRSSRLLRQEFPFLRTRLPTLWTHSYFVSTTGSASLDLVNHYIEGQKRG
jgi:putative transposase